MRIHLVLFFMLLGGIATTSAQDKGCVEGNCENGWGIYEYYVGDIYQGRYEGNFEGGKRTGKGKFIWANGIFYEGEFSDNRITGEGIYSWPDGSTY